MDFMRGMLFALLISLALWAIIFYMFDRLIG